MASDPEQIAAAVRRLQVEVPKLANLKLVFGLELTSGGLTGTESSERFRVALPGPTIEAGDAGDERVRLSVPRPMFALLAAEGELADWREAYRYGHLRAEGDPRVLRLLGKVLADD